MRAGAEVRVADQPDDISGGDGLACLQRGFFQMPVAGEDAASVVEMTALLRTLSGSTRATMPSAGTVTVTPVGARSPCPSW